MNRLVVPVNGVSLPDSAAVSSVRTTVVPTATIRPLRVRVAFSRSTVSPLTAGARRNEDIALDLMKFVAMTTGYGRTSSSGVGFQGSGAASKPEEYAGHLLELYGRCLQAVAGGKK